MEKLFRLDSCCDHIAKTEATLNGHISSTHCHAGGGVTQEKNATIIFQESRVIFQESRDIFQGYIREECDQILFQESRAW